MMPQIFKFGIINISSFGLCLFLGLIFFAFIFWRNLRDKGIEDEQIFDNFLFVVFISLITSRLGFIISHFDLFSSNLLKVFLIWKFPGLSLWGGLTGSMIAIFFYTRYQKLSLSTFFDAYGRTLPIAIFFISLAVFLDGTVVGRETNFILKLPAVGKSGLRNPIGIYGMILGILQYVIINLIFRKFSAKFDKSVYGLLNLSFLGLTLVILALLRSDLLYLGKLPVELILALILFLTSLVFLFKILRVWELLSKFKLKIFKI